MSTMFYVHCQRQTKLCEGMLHYQYDLDMFVNKVIT